MKSLLSLCFSLMIGGAAVAEETVQFQPGVLAKIYACGRLPAETPLAWNKAPVDVPEWPIKALPDSPVEVLRLKELPLVDATSMNEIANKKGEPSRLVASKADVLRGCHFYAVEFEGYYLSPLDGVYTIGVTSDDPVTVFIEGKQVLSSEFVASMIHGPGINDREPNNWQVDKLDDPRLVPSVSTAQGSVHLAPNKYYHVLILARQRWLPASRAFNSNTWIFTSDLNRGAVFRTVLTTPDGKTGPLPLALPVTK